MKKIDLLAFAAHPDDIELAAAGTLLKHQKLGYSIGIIDLTQGELGSRGSAELRKKEAEISSKILNLDVRENLKLRDGFFENNEQSKLAIIQVIRKYQPKIVLANAVSDRHPDHGRAAKLVSEACFLSGLIKIETSFNGKQQQAHRPEKIYHYIQDNYLTPDFVVDITEVFEQKKEAINAYSSQFHTENSSNKGVKTPISGSDFQEFLVGRARQFGRIGKCDFAEGFTCDAGFGVKNLFDLH